MDRQKTTPGGTSARTDASGGSDIQQDIGEAASGLRSSIQGLAEARAEQGMRMVAEQIESAARVADKTGSSLRGEQPQIATLAEEAASRMHDAAQYLEHHDARDLVSEADRFARREPMLVIAGGFLLGFAAARVLRVSAEDGSSRRSSRGRTNVDRPSSMARVPVTPSTGTTSAGTPPMRDAPIGGTVPGG